jgi:hypothetical protein
MLISVFWRWCCAHARCAAPTESRFWAQMRTLLQSSQETPQEPRQLQMTIFIQCLPDFVAFGDSHSFLLVVHWPFSVGKGEWKPTN